MKVGLILECGPDGPDKQVCEHLANQIRNDIRLLTVTLDNKSELIRLSGAVAAMMFAKGCQTVGIVWDLYPAWRVGAPDCREDCDLIRKSLRDAGVDTRNVHLVCIAHELEAWLLSDERALRNVLSTTTHRARVQRVNRPERLNNPKNLMNRMFLENCHRPYNDMTDALKIAKRINDFSRIRTCPSFVRFANKLLGVKV
jgi:hypothetical protein